MSRFAEHVYDHVHAELARCGEGLAKWPDEVPYVLSLFVYDLDDDPSKPTVTICVEYLPEEPEQLERWEADGELQWNYACFSQRDNIVLGADERDPVGQRLVAELLAGVPEEQRTQLFVAELIRAVQQVHREGLTQQSLGMPIPLLIHELEYYQAIATQNVEANGIKLTQPFVDWISDWYNGPERPAFDAAMHKADQLFRNAMADGNAQP